MQSNKTFDWVDVVFLSANVLVLWLFDCALYYFGIGQNFSYVGYSSAMATLLAVAFIALYCYRRRGRNQNHGQ